MNPLTNMKNVSKLSERELGVNNKSSWHDQYKDSAWIFIGGLPYDLSEGDIVCMFSQYGEVVNLNLVRDKDTGKSKGFGFLCYEDQRSTNLAVDNLNGIKILSRTIRVDHVADYKVPKEGKKTDEETKKLYSEGCAPKAVPLVEKFEKKKESTPPRDFRETIADQIESDIKLPRRLPIIFPVKREKIDTEIATKKIREEKLSDSDDNSSLERKKSKKKKKKRDRSNSEEPEKHNKKDKKHKHKHEKYKEKKYKKHK